MADEIGVPIAVLTERLRQLAFQYGEVTSLKDESANGATHIEAKRLLKLGPYHIEHELADLDTFGGEYITVLTGSNMRDKALVVGFGDYGINVGKGEYVPDISCNTLTDGERTQLESLATAFEVELSLVDLVETLAERSTSNLDETIGERSRESYTYAVPDSSLRVETLFESTGIASASTALLQLYDSADLLLEVRDGTVTLNAVTPEQRQQLERLSTELAVESALDDGPPLNNKLLLDADYFEFIAQGLTDEGYEQAKALLSQGDTIIPTIVEQLNALMATEESTRREYVQARGGDSNVVRYPRFTEEQLNRQLAPQFSQSEPVPSPTKQPQESAVMPSVYDRPQFELERLETLLMERLQAGEQLEVGTPMDGGILLNLSELSAPDGSQLVKVKTFDRNYEGVSDKGFLPAEAFRRSAAFAALLEGSLETDGGDPIQASIDGPLYLPIPEGLLSFEQLNVPSLNPAEGLGYTMSIDAELAYREQWSCSNLPLPAAGAAIALIPDSAYVQGTVPTLKQLLDGQRVLLDELQQSPIAPPLLEPLQSIASSFRGAVVEGYFPLQMVPTARQQVSSGNTLSPSTPYSVSYNDADGLISVFRHGSEAPIIALKSDGTYVADGLKPADAAFLQAKLQSEAVRFQPLQQPLVPQHDTQLQQNKPTSVPQAPVAPAVQLSTLKPKEVTMTATETKTSVYDRPDAEFQAMAAKAAALLTQGKTLVVPGSNGVTELSLTNREPIDGLATALMVDRTDGASVQEYEILLPKALRESCVLEAMHNGTLTTLDGQAVGLPDFAASKAIEAPASTPINRDALKPIPLDSMLSEFGNDAMRGITGTKTTYNPTTQRRETEERSPGETFAKFAKGAYGIENFCKDNEIPFKGSADYLVNKTALELDISPEFKAEILAGIQRDECVAPVILTTENEANAWKRVYELEPETFAAVASPMMQETIAQDESVIAQAKTKTLEALGITMKTAEPTRDTAKLGYEPAPATPETAALVKFRDSLTASQLREWATAVQVHEPQNTDKQQWVADFTAKFQKSGYEMSDGGMSVGMAKRLTEVQQQMQPDVAQLRTGMAATINQMLSQAPNVDGKDYKKLEAQSLGLTIKGREGDFEVKGSTGKLLMLAKDGDVTINRLPATTISRMEGMVDMQQKMQQATAQRTAAAPAKKAATVER